MECPSDVAVNYLSWILTGYVIFSAAMFWLLSHYYRKSVKDMAEQSIGSLNEVAKDALLGSAKLDFVQNITGFDIDTQEERFQASHSFMRYQYHCTVIDGVSKMDGDTAAQLGEALETLHSGTTKD